MTDLSVFLAARLDEAEAAAKAWLPFGNPTAAQREHIARHDPARVLRDVEADRKLIAAYEDEPEFSDPWIGLDLAIRIRAERFSDHPDYRQEWKP